MVAFYLYLGILGAFALYTLFESIKTRELETLIACVVSIGILAFAVACKAFGYYIPLIAFFLFTGTILIVMSDLGLLFMNPTPWKKLIAEFPTYTGMFGLITILAGVEMWIQYDTYWLLFEFIFGLLMSIAFITGFIRTVRWTRSGIVTISSILFAGILYYINNTGYHSINSYHYYWVISVMIQSSIFLFWRFLAKIQFIRLPEKFTSKSG